MTRTVSENNSTSHTSGRRAGRIVTAALALAVLSLMPSAASAQSGFTGTVTDSSGAVLPGVTVEAESPALIEKVRTAVTDTQGRYNIVDLRPGLYSVTFTLPGFGTVRREAVQLAAAFTATINAEMPVSTVQETIVVTGGASTVDLRSTSRQRTLSQELLDGVPSGGTAQYYATLLLGVSQDSVSFTSAPNSFRWSDLTFRGARESSIALDGFDTSHRLSGDGSQYMINSAMTQEIVVSGGAAGAEHQAGGLVTNVIPKTGGNRFSGTFAMHFANDSFVSDNLTDELRAVGVSTQSVRRSWDFNPAFGGPIMIDKLWFFGSYRNLGNKTDSGNFRDVDPLDWVYTPDRNRPTDSEQLRTRNYSLRLTWQPSPRNNVSIHGDHNPNDWDNRGGVTTGTRTSMAPEATVSGAYTPQYLAGGLWKSPVNDRLYLEAGVTITKNKQWFDRNLHDADTGEPVSPDPFAVGAQDLDTGMIFRGSHFIGNFNNTQGIRIRGAASYITGSHTLKVGALNTFGSDKAERHRIGDMIVRLRSGVPVSLQVWGPEARTSRLNSIGLFVQDQWILNRATLNLGVRYDYTTTSGDEQTLPANSMLPERHFAGVDKINYFHDLSPRLGISYDLFGNNRTAVKTSLNRYVANLESAQNRHPTALATNNTTRDWTDRNGNFIVDCDLRDFQLNGECGRLANLNFGSATSNPTQFDPVVDGGWGNRGYSWELSTSVQHHLMQGMGVELGYYRRWWGNQTVTQNLLTTPADYSPFCVRTPADSRLPGGGGQEMCGFYDLSPTKVGLVQSFVTHAKNFGDEIRIYNGIELSLNARLPNGLQLTGGAISERISTESCYIVNSPQQVFCNNTPPFRTTMKLMGVYPLPLGLQVSGAYQAIPGPAFNGTAVFSRNEILGLNRPLSTSTVTLTIVEPNSTFSSYIHKLDARLSKIFRIGEARVTGSLDIMNVFNSADVLDVNTNVGPSWQNPTRVMGGRLFRFAARYDF